MTDSKPMRPSDRPTKLIMREPIPDTPENVTHAIIQGSPMEDWGY